jgi:CheY-like chemotaxis protein
LPQAAPIFALVVHELMTNAAKYGALSVAEGQVMVSFQRREDGLLMRWVEMGGPEVTNSNERGFGTSLIEQAVPYELGGESELIFLPSGLQARLEIPNAMLAGPETEDEATALQDALLVPPAPVPEIDAPKGTVLLVEDNYMIAVDTMESLKKLGFEDVELAGNSEQAGRVLEAQKVVLPVLDINLGRSGNSVALAEDLDARGIPFFFVTGYGEHAPLPDALGTRRKLQKPILMDDLARAVAAALGDPAEMELN